MILFNFFMINFNYVLQINEDYTSSLSINEDNKTFVQKDLSGIIY